MPTHDIIDNRTVKLVDHINRILASTEAACFAVGYFFLSSLTAIADKLASVKELRLLIGNTTNRETLEQLAKGYKRIELVATAAETRAYPKRAESKRMAGETAENIHTGVEPMEQTDDGEILIKVLVRMVFKNLTKLYHLHNMREWLDNLTSYFEDHPVPRIICSEGLV